MAKTHEERLTAALQRLVALEEHAAMLRGMGIPVDRSIRELALAIATEEVRQGDGCLDRLERTWSVSRSPASLRRG